MRSAAQSLAFYCLAASLMIRRTSLRASQMRPVAAKSEIRMSQTKAIRSPFGILRACDKLACSRKHQRDEARKNWKFSAGDLEESALWPAYMSAYEGALGATSHC